jgi:DNA-binding GntR family transcriptional regulator
VGDILFRSNAGRKVLEALRHGIILRKYAPGERLIESRLAEEFGVGRGSVRAALQMLEREGLVKSKTNGGKEIRGFSRKDAFDTHDLRFLLEKRALEIVSAMEHFYTSPLLDVLGLIERQLLEATPDCDWHMTDILFHRAILLMARNNPLLKAWDIISPQIYSLMTLNTSAGYRERYIEEFYQKHKIIFDYIVTRNDRIFALIERHIADAKVISADLFDKLESGAAAGAVASPKQGPEPHPWRISG